MTPTIRAAGEGDAETLYRAIDAASDGVIPALWAQVAPEGLSGRDVGIGMILSPDGPFTHRNGWIAEVDGTPRGAMIGYPMTGAAAAADPDLPEAFRPIAALEGRATGYWYLNVIATDAGHRGGGIGAALLARAVEQARSRGLRGVALIVAGTNAGARRFYAARGFAERARAPFDVSAFDRAPTDALLLIRDL